MLPNAPVIRCFSWHRRAKRPPSERGVPRGGWRTGETSMESEGIARRGSTARRMDGDPGFAEHRVREPGTTPQSAAKAPGRQPALSLHRPTRVFACPPPSPRAIFPPSGTEDGPPPRRRAPQTRQTLFFNTSSAFASDVEPEITTHIRRNRKPCERRASARAFQCSVSGRGNPRARHERKPRLFVVFKRQPQHTQGENA